MSSSEYFEDDYTLDDRFYDFIIGYKNDYGVYVYENKIVNMALFNLNYLIIDFQELQEYSPTLGFKLITGYEKNREIFTTIIRNKIRIHNPEFAETLKKVDLRFINLVETTKIHELTNARLYRLIQIEGTVIQRSNPLVRAMKLAFKCKSCGQVTIVEQTQQYREYPKTNCLNCDGRKWVHIYEGTEFEDYQEIVVQELIENVPNGKSPRQVKATLHRGLIKTCEPGEDVILTGFLKVYDKSPKSRVLEVETYFDVNSLINKTDANTITLSERDIDEVKQLMKQSNYMENIVKSIAPTLYGMNHVKEALALQQCEGQARYYNKIRKRGQFHILLAGPPGYGKSELGDFMVQCHPKGRKAIGRGASGVGLTASVVKENEQFVLRAGAMALADNGFLFVDEIEKMSQTDSGAMHPGMEQQEIHINKADISATLKTRCSILAACNPLGGLWDDYKTVPGNLSDKSRGLPVPLLDRFALIFVIKQNYDIELESKVVDHILKINMDEKVLDVPYDVECLRKIFAYARTIKVQLTREVLDRLDEFYKTLYKVSTKDDSLIVTRRQPQDLIRLTEASARINGRDEASLEDAERAIRIVADSLKEYGIDPDTGKIDQLKTLYGASMTQREMIREIPTVIRHLCEHNVDQSKVSKIEFVKYACSRWNISESEVGKLLNVCLKDGTVFTPTPFDLSTP